MAVSSKRTGFTLIELAVVMVLVGIIAVVALPRLLSLSSDAHRGVYQGAFAAFRSGVQMYHNAWLAHGESGAVTNLANFGDGTVDSNAEGYPVGTSYKGKLNGDNCGELWSSLLDSDLTTREASNGSFDGDTSRPIKYWYRSEPDACYYIYVGEKNEAGVKLPTLTYTMGTGQTEFRMSSYSNG